MVLEVVIDVIFINFILNEHDDVIPALIHVMLECAPLPFSMIINEDDPFSLHLSFSFFQQIRKRKSIRLQGFPLLQTKQLRFLDQFT